MQETADAVTFLDSPERWKQAPAEFADGKLTILGHPVMEDWEVPYMRALAAIACMEGGVVLEIGFGLGLSAGFVQQHPISKHIIIEANADVFSKLKEFAATAPRPVEGVFGLWQDEIVKIPDKSVDGVLFDAYPLSADDVDCHYPFFVHANRILKDSGIFTYYSDEPEEYQAEHLRRLREAGFSRIDKQVCPVQPPPGCLYWKHDTYLVPMVRK